MRESNVNLARRGYEAALRGDLDAVADLLDPEVKWHWGDPTAAGACHNRKEALEFMRDARRRRPLGELVDVIDAGDRVVVLIGLQPNGTGPPATRANVSTFRDGKVVEMVHYPDARDALRAAGVEG